MRMVKPRAQATQADANTAKAPESVRKSKEPVLRIGDWEYDVSSFEKRHPGGSVIRFYFGEDATDAFENFHRNMSRAHKVLASLPRKPANSSTGATAITAKGENINIDQEFRAWQQSLVHRGFFKPSYIYTALKILEPILMYILGCAAMAHLPGWRGLAVALPLFGMANVKCGWIQHEAGHTSLTTNTKVDKFLQAIAIGLGLSTCGWQWNRMHNRHHATPQKINHDMDLDTMPLVGFFKGCVEKSRNILGVPVSKLWLRFQAWTFLPVVCGAVLWMYWVFSLHLKAAFQKDWKSLFFMLLSHALKPLLFVTFAGTTFAQGYALFMLTYWLTGMCLFGHFSLSHTFTPVVEEHEHKSWLLFALEHTVDISPGNHAVDWVMGYLNYQVIHHLFPAMPQFRGPKVSQELAELCKRWGVKYTTMLYGAAWRAMIGNLDQVGRHYWEESGGPSAAAALAKAKLA